MKTKHTSTSILDAALFLTRHMVILKEVFNSLEMDIRQQREDDAGSSSLRFAGTSRVGEFGGVTGPCSFSLCCDMMKQAHCRYTHYIVEQDHEPSSGEFVRVIGREPRCRNGYERN